MPQRPSVLSFFCASLEIHKNVVDPAPVLGRRYDIGSVVIPSGVCQFAGIAGQALSILVGDRVSILVDDEHVPLAVDALRGVVVGHCGVQAFGLVHGDGLLDEVLCVLCGLPLGGSFGGRLGIRCLLKLLDCVCKGGFVQGGAVPCRTSGSGRTGRPDGTLGPWSAGRPLRSGRSLLAHGAGFSLAGNGGQDQSNGRDGGYQQAHCLPPAGVLLNASIAVRRDSVSFVSLSEEYHKVSSRLDDALAVLAMYPASRIARG